MVKLARTDYCLTDLSLCYESSFKHSQESSNAILKYSIEYPEQIRTVLFFSDADNVYWYLTDKSYICWFITATNCKSFNLQSMADAMTLINNVIKWGHVLMDLIWRDCVKWTHILPPPRQLLYMLWNLVGLDNFALYIKVFLKYVF